MQEQQIQPHKVTKPIQLLAAWLVGLVLTNASFLEAALRIEGAEWLRGALVVAAIVNVPLFLLALFVLQTKFRAELQEDTFYSEYLSKKTSAVIKVDKNSAQDEKIEALEQQVAVLSVEPPLVNGAVAVAVDEVLDWTKWPVALNIKHPQFTDIRVALATAKIPLSEMFGMYGKEPDRWVVSIDSHMPTSHKVKILQALQQFKFDGFLFWQPVPDAGEEESVYIGSFGGSDYAPFTEELRDLLSGKVDPIDLKIYMARHARKRTA